MTGNFQYGQSVSFLDSIQIENIGDCCISAFNDLGEAFYLRVKTEFGQTRVIEYGPYVEGIVPAYCVLTFKQFQYSELKIDKIISKFLSQHNITQAMETDYESIRNNLINLTEYISDENHD